MSDPAAATLDWVRGFVIHHNLCPFAARPFHSGKVVAEVCPHAEHEAQFIWAGTQVQSIIDTPRQSVETSLLVFPEGLVDFHEFLGMAGALEELLQDSGADAIVQLAHFHPDYVFADVPEDDPANGTNRSPYPTIQLLRVMSVTEAVARHPDVEGIPVRNAALLRSLYYERPGSDT